MAGEEDMDNQDAAVQRLRAAIEQSRPAAVAGWPEFWARITGLRLAEATAGLETLVEQGVVRRQELGDRVLYVADPPHARPRPPRRDHA